MRGPCGCNLCHFIAARGREKSESNVEEKEREEKRRKKKSIWIWLPLPVFSHLVIFANIITIVVNKIFWVEKYLVSNDGNPNATSKDPHTS